jgi:hypothetical protein
LIQEIFHIISYYTCIYTPNINLRVYTLVVRHGCNKDTKCRYNELNKVVRATKPDMKIFIADALTRNDAIDQAKKFCNHTEFDGVIMT